MRWRRPVLAWLAAASAWAWQPDTAQLRKLFEDALSRRQHDFGDRDPRTAQAARDLGLFMCRSADAVSARRAMANAVHFDEQALGPGAPQTLEDVATLASASPSADAEPLLRRAAESSDPMVAGPALTSAAAMRKAAGDKTSAAALLRRAVEKADAVEKDGVTTALILNLLAQVVSPQEAVLLMERALAIDRQKLGPNDPQTLEDVRTLERLRRAPR
jgi:hypothetical protein